jgi:Domain of unknown function (DUF4149)
VKLLRNLFRVLFVLWAGSLWSLAAFVTPTLFYAQPDRHLAGTLAARLFSIETYLALGLSLLVLSTAARSKYLLGWLATALLVINEWALKPVMEQARVHGHALGLGFGAWHGVSALLYIVACVLVIILVWRDAVR